MLGIGSTLSAIMHGGLLATILFGWPALDILWDREWPWLQPERYRRVDVLIFSDKEDPFVAMGTGAISLATEVFGQGSAEKRGRAPGSQASMASRAARQSTRASAADGAPDRPSELAPSPLAQTETETETLPSDPDAGAPPQPEPQDETSRAEGRDRVGQAEQPPLRPESRGPQATTEADEQPASVEDQSAEPGTDAAQGVEMEEMGTAEAVAEASRPAGAPPDPQTASPAPPELEPMGDAGEASAQADRQVGEAAMRGRGMIAPDGPDQGEQANWADENDGEQAVAPAAPPQDFWKVAATVSPIILASSSLVSISFAAGTPQLSQLPSTAVSTKLLLRTMPGLDPDLPAAIAHPEAPLERPPTERRQRVFERMEAAAERGYAHAQYGVARRQLLGYGTPRDPVAAGEWLTRAAQQGHAPAQLALGYLAARGYGVGRDLSESLLRWTLAGEDGNEAAARAANILEPLLSPEALIRARRELTGWRASLGTTIPDSRPGGDETPKSRPLEEAIAAGDLAAVHSLLARGEDADGRDIDGRTALINAGWRGDRRISRTLLEVGADPDVIDKEGKTALIWAASNGHLIVVQMLMAAGTELDIQDDKGLTALMRAAWNGYTDVVEAGADASLRDRSGKSALDHAENQGYDDIVAILEAGS